MSNTKKLIGAKIKERRTALGISQRELAEIMGYSNHSTIARIEAGSVDLPQSKIVGFADALSVTPAYLMGWEKEPEDLAELTATILQDSDLLAMIEEYMVLSGPDQKAVRAMVDALATKGE